VNIASTAPERLGFGFTASISGTWTSSSVHTIGCTWSTMWLKKPAFTAASRSYRAATKLASDHSTTAVPGSNVSARLRRRARNSARF
jgi:hypothetical protein